MKKNTDHNVQVCIFLIASVLFCILFITSIGKSAWVSLVMLLGSASVGFVVGIGLCEIKGRVNGS